MVKKAALSVRISEFTKKALDEEAAKERRSTASLVEIILQDWLQARLSGAPRKYLMPNGKTLAECTGEELKAIEEAYSALWPR